MPIDPWGHTYHFKNPGDHGDIDTYTLGADNKAGGKGINATIGNWNATKMKQSPTQ